MTASVKINGKVYPRRMLVFHDDGTIDEKNPIGGFPPHALNETSDGSRLPVEDVPDVEPTRNAVASAPPPRNEPKENSMQIDEAMEAKFNALGNEIEDIGHKVIYLANLVRHPGVKANGDAEEWAKTCAVKIVSYADKILEAVGIGATERLAAEMCGQDLLRPANFNSGEAVEL
jgi:hypothetical protein